jgi:hypothetical protein
MSLLAPNGQPIDRVEDIKVRPPLISPEYADLQRQLHASEPTYGCSGQMWGRYVERLIETEKFKTVLDYGCGKGTLAEVLPNYKVAEYDPNIDGKNDRPQPAELVVCTDVLEHIEPDLIDNVLADLRSLTQKKLFFNIATRPAKKVLADGRNAHILLQPAEWWYDKLKDHFTVTFWEDRKGMVYGEALPGGGLAQLMRGGGYKRRTRKQRRTIEREMQPIANMVREATARYGDALSRIRTVEQWEPWDETHADMLVVGKVLECLDPTPGPGGSELQRAMVALQNQVRCAVCIVIQLDHLRGPDWWRKFLDKFLIISEWTIVNGLLYCIGAPHTKVAGVKTVMGVKDDRLWDQARANMARTAKRIVPRDPHERLAILVCYGPSLKYPGAIDAIKARKAEGGADIISVSGSHDFLLDHGVTPDIHVECDPRPHKALNIARGIADIDYQIASIVHEDVFKRLDGCSVSLWHVSMQDFMVPLVDEYKEKPETVISGGGSVGLRAIPLLYAQGYRRWDVHAMDCSFADEGKEQWAGKHAGKTQEITTCDVNLPEGRRTFHTSPVLMTYATNFVDLMRKMDDCVFRVYGDGLLTAMVRYYTGLEMQS